MCLTLRESVGILSSTVMFPSTLGNSVMVTMRFVLVQLPNYGSGLTKNLRFNVGYEIRSAIVAAIIPLLCDSRGFANESRFWMSASGKHAVKAEYMGFLKGKVILRREDGKSIESMPHTLRY